MGSDIRETILLVEDEALIALASKQLLEEHEYSVVLAASGPEAVEIAESDATIDLILMDIDLGSGMDGTQAAAAILERRTLPIVFLTNHGEDEYIRRVKATSRYGYVLKSSGDLVLLESVATALELFAAYEALKVRERRLETAERLAGLGNWEMNLATGETVWSDEFFRICGYEPGEAEPSQEMGMSIIHPDDRVRAEQALEHALETGEPYDVEKRVVRPDGTIRYVHSVGEVVKGRDGKPARLVGSFLDITDRRRMVRAVEETQAGFAAFMNHLPGAAFLKTAQSELLYCNDTYAALLGTTAEALLCENCTEELEPQLQEQYDRENRQVVQERRLLVSESRFHANGTETYWLTYKFPVDVHGQTLLGGISIDITERKRAEAALAESERRFRYVLKHDPNAIAVYDKNLKYIIASDRYLNDYGIADSNVEGRHHYDVFPEIPQRWREIHQRVLNGETLSNKNDSFVRDDGSITYNSWECRPWFDSAGEVAGMITYTEVTTDRVLAERQKDLLMKELNHRTKNNLSLVSSLIRLKDEAIGDAADLSDIAGEVAAIRLTHETLDAGGGISETSLARYLRQIIGNVFSFRAAAPVRLEYDVPNLMLATRKAVPLGLIVNELATNAMKHGFREGEEATFAISVQRNEGELIVTISNSGNPFPEEVGFESLDTLGLRLIAALVEQLSGTIDLLRNPVPVFTLRFPVE